MERAGLLTTGISLVRENTASLQPPRALWVSFPLGRPLGVPGDAAFQHGVIAAALELLSRPKGPVLADYPRDAPSVDASTSPACPVSFAKPHAGGGSWQSQLASELASMRPWYDLGQRRRDGRTLVGVSAEPVETNLQRLGALLDVDELPLDDLNWFKLAIEDAKVFYLEALTAQPGEYDPRQVQNTLWKDTVLGAALVRFYEMFHAREDLRLLGRLVAPREAIGGSTGEEIAISAAPESSEDE